MDDDWMFEVLGAIGAQLERHPDGRLALVYRFAPDQPPAGPAADGFPVDESPDVTPEMDPADAADVVERRLSRHFSVSRVEDVAGDSIVRVWTLSERSASPGLDQPVT